MAVSFIPPPILRQQNIVMKHESRSCIGVPLILVKCQHMQQAWLITRKAGYVPDSFSLEHKNFGVMLGKDGKPFKTRTAVP